MAKPSTASRRIGLMGLAVAGALAGSAGSAAAQYYYYDDYYDAVPVVPYPPAYGYRYRYAPRIAEPVTTYDIRRIATDRYGFVRIDRLYRTGDTYVVDGMRANGQRQRLVLDAFAGNLIRRVPLRGGQAGQAPDIARIDPQQEREPPRPHLVPKPPQRPAALKPPSQASAPATIAPPAPATPAAGQEAPSPAPTPPPPVEASAPATQTAPSPEAAPAAPSPGPVDATSGAEKPRLVNPQDVRGTDEAERKPPLSSPPPASAEAAVPLAPVQGQDSNTAKPKPETPIAPVAPLN
ncbi:MAG: hypothetical protein J0I54_00310 [Bosea sp.]|uniref:hypothetical protein n=1 Tax=unclassified Bosea (in: a-proteobacteria) TaxID=2653178 RepID=UPI000AE932B8|nr:MULTISPECIES: hypothetical protein [unclassified Bosea (in: a-proteobacteria)]MBN9455046.1 hypothetical protein [Bosea sp. (in: a-proteobacteria)]